jgi:hypothetical protein
LVEILGEVRRNLATRPDLSDAAIEYRLMQMNRALPSALDSAPDELIDSMPINPKDRHVLALAVHKGAPFVISHNLRDFPDVMCARFGVLVTDAYVDLRSWCVSTGHGLGAKNR